MREATVEDVLNYYRQISTVQEQARLLNPLEQVSFITPEQLFSKELVSKAREILKKKDIADLKNRIGHIKEVELPKLEKQLKELLLNER